MSAITQTGVMNCTTAELETTCLSFLRVYDDAMQLATDAETHQTAETAFNELENFYLYLRVHPVTYTFRNKLRMLLKHYYKLGFTADEFQTH
jgi:hypothetical protein